MHLVRLSLLLACLGVTATAVAGPQAQKYCNEMYPAESYDPEERSLFVNECLESYGDEIEEEAAAAPDVREEEGYYNGSVEEFVESAPAIEETEEQQE